MIAFGFNTDDISFGFLEDNNETVVVIDGTLWDDAVIWNDNEAWPE